MTLRRVYEGHSHTDALIVRGLLESAGLHPTVPGEELVDEFSQSRKLVGGLAAVWVPAEEEARALRVLQEAHDAAREGFATQDEFPHEGADDEEP